MNQIIFLSSFPVCGTISSFPLGEYHLILNDKGMRRRFVQKNNSTTICCLYVFMNRVKCSCLLQIFVGRVYSPFRANTVCLRPWCVIHVVKFRHQGSHILRCSNILIPTVRHTHLHLHISELLFSSKCLVLLWLTFKKGCICPLIKGDEKWHLSHGNQSDIQSTSVRGAGALSHALTLQEVATWGKSVCRWVCCDLQSLGALF